MNQYTLKDRSTSDRWEITISDGELSITSTLNYELYEPIITDSSESNKYWRLFIDDGQLGIEEVSTTGNEKITLYDSISETYYQLLIEDGQINISEVSGDNDFLDCIKDDFHTSFLDTDVFGVDITYKPEGLPGKVITAIILEDISNQEFEDDQEDYLRTIELIISTDSNEGISNPSQKDFVTIDGLQWGVVNIARDRMGTATLTVERVESVTKGVKTI